MSRHAARLILWDIDQTLIEAGGTTRQAYAAAFLRTVGHQLEHPWQFNGRTELAAVREVLRAHGVEPTPGLVAAFLEQVVAELSERADQIRRNGRVLDGAEAALRACRAAEGTYQSVLTGNLYPLAALKLSLFGLADYLDLRLGAYGGDAIERTELLQHAWDRAHRQTGHRFSGSDTVIVGDTLLDVATGTRAGARAVAVATGPFSVAELRAAGADVVLPSLADTTAVVGAILAPREPGR
ncbi:MAG TPA: haloacid dehalogenase-like hydrolase [Jatrophihabitans sp.]|jgi:phosphoglycolate phosphatase-like HAD superfamily hydrolase|nr:haloacid dehalogenase-like hydrolase [Jatrophihabitans sp.]